MSGNLFVADNHVAVAALHVIYAKRAICHPERRIELEAMPASELPVFSIEGRTCADCILLATHFNVERETAHEATATMCAPDCAESCCTGIDDLLDVDVEAAEDVEDAEAVEDVAAEQQLVLYTSAPDSADMPGTVEHAMFPGRLGQETEDLLVRQVAVPASRLKAQRSAYAACADVITATATQWQEFVTSGAWQGDSAGDASPQSQSTPEVMTTAPAEVTAEMMPDAPATIIDNLIYTSAPDACDLKRTETILEQAGVYQGQPVRLVRMHPEDVARQARMYLAEDHAVALDTKAWRAHGVQEQALDADVAWLQALCGQGADAIKALLRSGELVRRKDTAPQSAVEHVKANEAKAPVIRHARNGSSEGSSTWRQAPAGLAIPEFVIIAGPKDESPIPAEYKGQKTGHCKCGQRWYGNSNRGGRCSSCWKAYMAHRNSYIDAAAAKA